MNLPRIWFPRLSAMHAMRALLVFWVASLPVLTVAADRAWEFQGDFVSLKPGNSAVAIFQLPDKTRIEVPLAALAEADRAAIREALKAERPAAPEEIVTTRGPLGKSVALAVPAVIKAIETDAVWCTDARDAVILYKLYLVNESLSAAERSAAEVRLAEWQKLADEKRVRQGSEWVLPVEREEVRRQATAMLQHAIQLLKSGNAKGAEAELEKASRVDPEDGRAEFVLGLAYAMGGGVAKAGEHFLDASRRDPDDPWVFNNLAVCEYNAGRFGSIAGRFKKILDTVPDAQVVADNVGIASVALGSAKLKGGAPAKVVADLNDLYREVIQGAKLQPVENAGSRKLSFVTPYGKACSTGASASLPAFLEPPREWIVGSRVASGISIADGWILTSRHVLGQAGDAWIDDPRNPGRRLPAIEAASFDDPPVSLLRCEGLAVAPLALADKMPPPGSEIMAAVRMVGPLADGKPEVAFGKVISAARQDMGGAFIHSAAVMRGMGGGPIVDQVGRLVGLVSALPRTEASGNSLGVGIPVEQIWPLLKEQIANLQPSVAADPAPPRDAVQARVAEATVRVLVVEKKIRPKTE